MASAPTGTWRERVRLAVYLKALACNVKRMSGNGWTRCWPDRLSWPPLSPLNEATGAVASPLMPTRRGMAHHNDLIGHNTSPDRNNQIPHLTALTPQNQPGRPLLRGNQG